MSIVCLPCLDPVQMTKEVFVDIQCEYSVCSVHYWQQEVMSLVFTFGVAQLHVVFCVGG